MPKTLTEALAEAATEAIRGMVRDRNALTDYILCENKNWNGFDAHIARIKPLIENVDNSIMNVLRLLDGWQTINPASEIDKSELNGSENCCRRYDGISPTGTTPT